MDRAEVLASAIWAQYHPGQQNVRWHELTPLGKAPLISHAREVLAAFDAVTAEETRYCAICEDRERGVAEAVRLLEEFRAAYWEAVRSPHEISQGYGRLMESVLAILKPAPVMWTIQIANANLLPPPAEWPEHYVYVGRAMPRRGMKGSPLRNPFRVGARYGGSDRLSAAEAVRCYEGWLRGWLGRGDGPPQRAPIVAELQRLVDMVVERRELVLVCWCAPDPCHARVISDVLTEWLAVAEQAKCLSKTP